MPKSLLFELDGTLICPGNAAAHGGYITPGQFVDPNNVGVKQMLILSGGCGPPSAREDQNQSPSSPSANNDNDNKSKKKHW